MNPFNTDTIVAIATPPGGAIGMIRLSGPKAIGIAETLFCPAKRGARLAEARANSLHYGRLFSIKGEEIDEVVVSVYRAPHSYTGEDSIEISCHGSPYILSRTVHAAIDAGARQAQPGEYTQRAYLNGKLDLSQAEAVADLIASTNRAGHRIAMSQLKGHFSSELATLRTQLLKMTSLVELELDFSDHEELEFADRKELQALAEEIRDHVTSLAQSFETGNAVKKGIPVAIIGKTNVGKSTLLNQLLGEDKAIVSDIHGTTRDVIEDAIDIQGVTFRFIDTAGLRHTEDQIERIGIERTYEKLSEAAIVLWVVDSLPTEEESEDIRGHAEGKKVIMVRNKADVVADTHSPITSYGTAIPISAKYGHGIEELKSAIYTAADIPHLDENSVIVTNARHYEALMRALAGIERVVDGLDLQLSADLLAEDLRICLDELGEITGGTITSDEVLGNIFKHFCIGK